MTWLLIMLSIAGPVILAEEIESQEQCLAVAKEHKHRFMSEQKKVPPMYCVAIQEQTLPMMEIPGKWI